MLRMSTLFLRTLREDPADAEVLAVGEAELVGVAEDIAVEAIPLAGACQGDVDLGAAIAVAYRVGGVHAATPLGSRCGGVVQAVADPVGDRIGRVVGPNPGGGGGGGASCSGGAACCTCADHSSASAVRVVSWCCQVTPQVSASSSKK